MSWFLIILGLVGPMIPAWSEDVGVREALEKALRAQDPAAVKDAVARGRRELGERAGVPEVADAFAPTPEGGEWLTSEEARRGFAAHLDRIDRVRW